jgi:four helix bundle protein
MSDFRKLSVWSKAHALTLRVYAVTKRFPREETYGLAAQLRRAAVSVGSNIAEGTGRNTAGELRQSLGYAQGSVHEIQYQFMVGRDLGYISAADYAGLEQGVREVRAMLDALLKRV